MQFLYVFLLLQLALIIDAAIPERVLSKREAISLYVDSLGSEKMGYGDWYPEIDGENLMIKTFIEEGDVVFDAGAHIGEWSRLVLDHTSNNVSLYSFEPVPYFFDKLVANVDSMSRCYNMALGDIEASVEMNYYYEESEGCSSLYDREVLRTIPVKKITVPMTSVDAFCNKEGIASIDYLKIDVEGCEWGLIKGAGELIKNKKIKFIQFEYGGTYPDADITLKQVYDYLQAAGYEIFRITSDGLIYIPSWRSALENYGLCNYLAVLR